MDLSPVNSSGMTSAQAMVEEAAQEAVQMGASAGAIEGGAVTTLASDAINDSVVLWRTGLDPPSFVIDIFA